MQIIDLKNTNTICPSFGKYIGAKRTALALLVSVAATGAGAARAAESTQTLQTIDVTATGVSNMDSASSGDVSAEEIQSQPLLRPAAILENVPGLIVTQHSGEGKANQYFLRAFNLDHGTDLATEVDNMPVNFPTHAHGQGYTDLNFLIPELVSDLHFKKGPYFADEGDFATAGADRIGLVNHPGSSVSLGFGQDGYRRLLAIGDSKVGDGNLVTAGEVYHNDGPWKNPDDYNKLNGFMRYHKGTDDDFYTVTAMAYTGKWNSTDQVPEHAITDGVIDRFGTLAPTDGGNSSRYSLSYNKVTKTESNLDQFTAYAIRYKLDLYSTFTYALTADPDAEDSPFNCQYCNSDQMLQHDDRVVYGAKASRTWFADLGGYQMSNLLGAQFRIDDINDVGLNGTINRQVTVTPRTPSADFPGVIQDASVLESNGAVFFENNIEWTDKVRTVIGLREDAFTFNVKDKMTAPDGTCDQTTDPLGCDTGTRRASMFSPKFGLVLGPWANTSYFLNIAEGYHSNDARGVTRGANDLGIEQATPLVRAKAAEIGVRSVPVEGWETEIDVFMLKLASELVFAGDAGDTGPSGATTRTGVEIANKFHFTDWLVGDLNGAITKARFDKPISVSGGGTDDLGCGDSGADGGTCGGTTPSIDGRYIPNSPTSVFDYGLTAQSSSGWFGTIRGRSFGPSPLVEDNSIKSHAYTTFDLAVGYQEKKEWRFTVDMFNIFDKKWDDIEYYYAVRLPGEASAQPDYVVHSGVPRTLRATFTYYM